jgi:hypothetical protein
VRHAAMLLGIDSFGRFHGASRRHPLWLLGEGGRLAREPRWQTQRVASHERSRAARAPSQMRSRLTATMYPIQRTTHVCGMHER